MTDCMSVFCGARSSTDTLRSQKDQPVEKNKHPLPENKHGSKEQQTENSPEVELAASHLETDVISGGQVTGEALQNDWEELKEQQHLIDKEMHLQEELKEKQEEKLRQLQITLENVHRRQSYQDNSSGHMAQNMSASRDNDLKGNPRLPQHVSLQNLHPQYINANQQPQLQRPDLLPQHKSLPQVHQTMLAPLPPPPSAITQMQQEHFQRFQLMQQQFQQQQQQYMHMMQPPMPTSQPVLHPLQPCQEIQMKHLQHMQRMQEQLSHLHSISHDSLLRKKPYQSHVVMYSSEQKCVNQDPTGIQTESVSFSSKEMSHTRNQEGLIEEPGLSSDMVHPLHTHSPQHGCYSNVDLSNPFPVPMESKPRPFSVYEGFFNDSQTQSDLIDDSCRPPYRTPSSSDIDIPSLEESDVGSLSELLSAGNSSTSISLSEITESQVSDSEDENRSHYDDLPHGNIVMDDDVCVSSDVTGKGPYVRRNSCPDVFTDQSRQHAFHSDFSGSTDDSEDNTSEITDTFSQSLESSFTEECNESSLNHAEGLWDSQIVPDTEHHEFCVEDLQIASQATNGNKAQWSELSKSAITGLLEEMDDLSEGSTEEGNEEIIDNLQDSHQGEPEQNGDVVLDVDVITDSDYDADTDTLEKRQLRSHVNNDVVNDDDDDATLTGDSCADSDSDVMQTVIRRDVKKESSVDAVTEPIYSPVIKRRGICEPKIASSQTSLSSVSHPKMATVLQQQQPFKAKKTTWAMSCLRPCPPIRPSNFARDDATKSPRIGRKSSVNRRKPVEDVKTLEDDAHLLKVIEAYCTSAKTRQTVNSSLLDSPQMLIAEEEKIIVEEMKGNQTVVEEKTLVDTVYSLKDQVKELKTEHKRMRKDLEDERRARKRLEGLLRKSLRSLVETTWEEGATTS